jgi:hypothetical protein
MAAVRVQFQAIQLEVRVRKEKLERFKAHTAVPTHSQSPSRRQAALKSEKVDRDAKDKRVLESVKAEV